MYGTSLLQRNDSASLVKTCYEVKHVPVDIMSNLNVNRKQLLKYWQWWDEPIVGRTSQLVGVGHLAPRQTNKDLWESALFARTRFAIIYTEDNALYDI